MPTSQRSIISRRFWSKCHRSQTWTALGAPIAAPRVYSLERSRVITSTEPRSLSQAARLSAVRSGSRSTTRRASRSTRIVPPVPRFNRGTGADTVLVCKHENPERLRFQQKDRCAGGCWRAGRPSSPRAVARPWRASGLDRRPALQRGLSMRSTAGCGAVRPLNEASPGPGRTACRS
jgi:hypothetical protein